MRFKRAGFLTKIVVLGMLIFMATALMDLRSQISLVQQQKAQTEVRAEELKQKNEQLSAAIANSDDPAVLEQAARDEGYIKEGEVLYRDIAR